MIEDLETKYKKEKINLTTRKGENIEMSVYEMSRWFCLIEAIDIVDKKIKQSGISTLNNDKFWVKPIPIQKYIDSPEISDFNRAIVQLATTMNGWNYTKKERDDGRKYEFFSPKFLEK